MLGSSTVAVALVSNFSAAVKAAVRPRHFEVPFVCSEVKWLPLCSYEPV